MFAEAVRGNIAAALGWPALNGWTVADCHAIGLCVQRMLLPAWYASALTPYCPRSEIPAGGSLTKAAIAAGAGGPAVLPASHVPAATSGGLPPLPPQAAAAAAQAARHRSNSSGANSSIIFFHIHFIFN